MRKSATLKILLGAAALAVAFAFHAYGLGEYLTLESLKGSRASIDALYAARPFFFLSLYAGVYILVAALSVPGAAVLTLAGGAVMGFVPGTVAASFASTAGATLACMASRFLFQGMVERRFGGRLGAIAKGVEREGAFYLFSLRMIPAFPFFLVNLAMGLTRMPLGTFYWVSQVGMLPGTMAYVYAGRELGRINSLSDVLSPGLWIAFAVIGLLPIAARKIVGLYRARREAGGKT